MDLGLKDKSVVILASSQGLGKATAMQFAQEGAKVVISSRRESELKNVVSEIIELTGNEQVTYHPCDITKKEEIKRLITFAAERNGTIDVLVNNAGGPPPGTFDQFDDEAWQKAFELNLLSFIRAIREVVPYMRKQKKGHIVNFASSSIKQTIDNLLLSNTFRAGIVGLSKSLSQEFAKDNILINTIGPGKIGTSRVKQLDEANAKRLGLTYEDIREQNESGIPMGRYGTPEEFAKLAVFLCSEANTYITGQTILVDGGMVKAL